MKGYQIENIVTMIVSVGGTIALYYMSHHWASLTCLVLLMNLNNNPK